MKTIFFKRIRNYNLSTLIVLALLLGSLAFPTGVLAAGTITVNSLADDTNAGDASCTLREALNNANTD